MLRRAGDYYVIGYGENIDVPTIDIISTEINFIGNLVGSYTDLQELMVLAAQGKVTLHTQQYASTTSSGRSTTWTPATSVGGRSWCRSGGVHPASGARPGRYAARVTIHEHPAMLATRSGRARTQAILAAQAALLAALRAARDPLALLSRPGLPDAEHDALHRRLLTPSGFRRTASARWQRRMQRAVRCCGIAASASGTHATGRRASTR